MAMRSSLLVGGAAAAAIAYLLYRRRRRARATDTSHTPHALPSPQLFNCSVRLCVIAERRDEFLREISKAQTASLCTEPRALCYVFGEDTKEAGVFHVHQQFASREDFEAQMETAHGAAFHAFLRTGPLSCRPVAAIWQTVPGSPTGPTAAATKTAHGSASVRCLNVTMRVRPERREEFLRSILADQAGTLANEPLALRFLVGESWTVDNMFYLHEQYVGEQGFEAHLRAPHFKPWQKFVDSEPFIEPLEVSFFDQM